MRKATVFLAAMLAVLMLVGSVGLAEATFPIVEEKITLRVLVPYSSERLVAYSDLDIYKEYEEMTNIHIEFIEVSTEAWSERLPLILASGDLPDVIMCGNSSAQISDALVTKYAEQGVIIPLNDLIDQTTNIRAKFEEREDFARLTTYPDGNIYTIPDVDENLNLRINNMLFVNETWLDNLGLEWPETLEALREYLRLVRDNDVNGNGDATDEIGLSFIKNDNCNQLKLLFGSFGITDSAQHIFVEDDHRLTFSPTDDRYFEALKYFHEWYVEGLIDPEILTQGGAELKAKATEGIGASLEFWYLSLNNGDQSVNKYVIIPPLAGEDGTVMWLRNGVMPNYKRNSFLITSANQYPLETMQWLDYWLDNGERTITMRFGNEGDTWSWLEDGTWAENTVAKDGVTTINYAYASQFSSWTYVVPYWQFSDLFAQKSITRDIALMRGAAIADWYNDVTPKVYPALPFSEADNEIYLDITTDLFSYVENRFSVFLTEGVTQEQWDEYVKTCKAYGSEDYIALAQTYYDAYISN